MSDTHCARCGAQFVPTEGSTGYGVRAESGDKVCFACCALFDVEDMHKNGEIALYLSEGSDHSRHVVSNWPGTLVFQIDALRNGKHNIAGTRTDVWFRDSDGARWHGVLYGSYTQLLRCKICKKAKSS